MPNLYSDALTNVIGTIIYVCVYAWVHTTRDYGVLYNNSRPFVVPIPLLSVDPLAIAINTGILSLLPAFSHLLPTNRLYAAQTCENIGTPHSPFFFSPQLFRANRFYDAKILPDFCGLPSFFFQNTHNLHCISYSRTIDVVSCSI